MSSPTPTTTYNDSTWAALVSVLTTSASVPLSAIPAAISAFDESTSEMINSTGVDPYLEALPSFSYAMPVQLIVLSVTITLLGILLAHLLFTIRYHFPLSKLNYCFQTSAVLVCLVGTCAQLQIVMHTLRKKGRSSPYMFDYIEVAMPPSTWNLGETAAWQLLLGFTSLIVHATHIQFLTMLFPSEMERKLILGLLGPLALATAGLSFTTLSNLPAVNDLGDAIRNTCNSSLTMLYTFALFIWGLTLNRSRAWRTDGGTATFGAVAMFLGVLGTAVNFVEIKEDRMRWLPAVVYCILLWQSWVGFWWWVGAGMWTGEAEDVEKREAKKKRRAEAKRRKKEAKERLERGETAASSKAGSVGNVGSSLRRRMTRNATAAAAAAATTARTEEIELQEMNGTGAASANESNNGDATSRRSRPSRRMTSHPSDTSVSSGSTPPPSNHFYSPVVEWFAPYFSRLRVAHDEAAVAKAALPPRLPEDLRRGWGIRALMLTGKRERGERREAARGAVEAEVNSGERRAGFEADGGTRLGGEDWEEDAATESGTEERYPPRTRENANGRVAPPVPRENGEEPVEPERRGFSGYLANWRRKDVSKF